MSQAGSFLTTVAPLPPDVPTTFVSDSGTVVPALNVVNVNGAGGIIVSANPNLSNNMVITATGGGFTWVDATSSTQALLAEHGYITDRGAGVTYTLPASGALGDTIKIVGKLGLATVAQNANQKISIASLSTTVGVTGSIVSTNVGDCIELICITAGASTVWRADFVVGNWTVI